MIKLCSFLLILDEHMSHMEISLATGSIKAYQRWWLWDDFGNCMTSAWPFYLSSRDKILRKDSPDPIELVIEMCAHLPNSS